MSEAYDTKFQFDDNDYIFLIIIDKHGKKFYFEYIHLYYIPVMTYIFLKLNDISKTQGLGGFKTLRKGK